MKQFIGLNTIFVYCLLSLIPLSSDANIQPRIISGTESSRADHGYMAALMRKQIGILVNDTSYEASYLFGSPLQFFSGKMVDCALAFEACSGAKGYICLIQRGTTTFLEKVANCEKGGGIAAIIYNNEEEQFRGHLGTDLETLPSIPSISTNRENGVALLVQLGEQAKFGYLTDIPINSYCGASYIGGKWVLTAAHCVDDIPVEALSVNIGGHDLAIDQDNVIDVTRIIIHTKYGSQPVVGYDIALLELAVKPTDMRPLSIADDTLLASAIVSGAMTTALGRGGQNSVAIGETPLSALPEDRTQLFEVDLPLVISETCNTAMLDAISNNQHSGLNLPTTDVITEDMLCAGRPEGNIGTCFGDSGGPLILKQDDTIYLVGITSWGLGCGQPNTYDIFTRVPFFKADIDAVISGESATLGAPLLSNTPPPNTNHNNDTQFRANEQDSGKGSMGMWLLFAFSGGLLGRIFKHQKNHFAAKLHIK